MNLSSRVLLVLLRLAIGWHFLVEGYEKIHSHHLGVTATNKPWSPEGYFREAWGPLAPLLRWQIGDPDARAIAILTPNAPAGETPNKTEPYKRMPVRLHQEWQAYADRLAAHYNLTPEQRSVLTARLAQLEDGFVTWLDTSSKPGKHTYPSGDVERTLTPAQRLADFQAKLAEVADSRQHNYAFGGDVEGPRLRTLKGDATKLRKEIEADVDEYTKQMQAALADTLAGSLTEEQAKRGDMPAPAENLTLTRMGLVVRWMLVAVGFMLLFGLLTRTGCVVAALFLASVYFTAPPLPWFPTPPNAEGHYLIVNKTLIEMLALLALATLPTGRWFGLDALFAAPTPTVAPAPTPTK